MSMGSIAYRDREFQGLEALRATECCGMHFVRRIVGDRASQPAASTGDTKRLSVQEHRTC